MLDVGEVARAWRTLHPLVDGNGTADTVAKADAGAVAQARAFLASQQIDTAGVEQILGGLYPEAYAAGVQSGRSMLNMTTDWSTWEPGYGAAASEAYGTDAGRGLATLLANDGVTIQSIADNRLDDLAGLLGDALDSGDSVDTLARQLGDVLTDPSRAFMVADTETARAMDVAQLDEYHANGVTGQQFLAEDDACELCIENEDAGVISIDADFPNGPVPVHPYCRCATAPARLEEADDGEGGGG